MTTEDKGGWVARVSMFRHHRIVQVLPLDDMKEHLARPLGACWCKPDVETFTNGNMVIVHHAADGRELIEEHGIQ